MASTETSNTTPLPQMGPAEMSGLARRLNSTEDEATERHLRELFGGR